MTHKQFLAPDHCVGCPQFNRDSLSCQDSMPRSKMKDCICKACLIKAMCDDACDEYIAFIDKWYK